MEAGTETYVEPRSVSLERRPGAGRLWRSAPVRFGLHYLEMLAVMFTGMMVIGPILALIAAAAGYGFGELRADAPALVLAGMGFSMTAPMVWWMRRRGHSWPANRAMAISMVTPTVAAIALLAAGSVDDLGALLEIQHMAMLPGMLVAMLVFRREYLHRSRAA
jgi:hypothetical protein